MTLTIAFAACSKTHNCECLVSYYGETQTISMGEYDGECSSISIYEIASHVGGNVNDPQNYRWSCYEK